MPKTFEEFNNKLTALFTLNCYGSRFFDAYNIYGDCLNKNGDKLVYGRVYGTASEKEEETNFIEQIEIPTITTTTTTTSSGTLGHSATTIITSNFAELLSHKYSEVLSKKDKYSEVLSKKDSDAKEDLRISLPSTRSKKTTSGLAKHKTTIADIKSDISYISEPKLPDCTKNYFKFSLDKSYFEILNAKLTSKNTIMFSFKVNNSVTFGTDVCLATFTIGSTRIILTANLINATNNSSVSSAGLTLECSSGVSVSYTSSPKFTKLFNNEWHNVILSLYNEDDSSIVKAKLWLDGQLVSWVRTNKSSEPEETCTLVTKSLTDGIIRFGDDRRYVSKGFLTLGAYGQYIKNIRVYSDIITKDDTDLIGIFSANNETIVKPDGTLWTKSIGEHIPRTKVKETHLHEIDSRNGLSNNSTLRFWAIDEWGRNEESGEESGVSYEEQLVLYDEVAKIKKIGEY